MDEPDDPKELIEIAADRRRWPRDLSSAEAVNLFVNSGLMLVATMTPPGKARAYQEAFIGRASKDARMAAVQSILSAAGAMAEFPAGMALAPFLSLETDPEVLSTASLCFCTCAFPSEIGDVTAGAGMVIEAVRMRLSAGDSEGAGALASGIVLLGDERFLRRMREAWDALDESGREAMVGGNSGLVADAHVRFLIERLEALDEPALYGAVAAALHRLGQGAEATGVFAFERQIPVAENPERPVRVVDSWTKEAYFRRIEPKLAALEAKEPGAERVMPMVLAVWR